MNDTSQNTIVMTLKNIGTSLLKLAEVIESQNSNPAPETNKIEEKASAKKELLVDLPQVRKLLANLSRSGKAKEVKELIESYNVKKLSDIDPANYDDLYRKAQVIKDAA